jgi:hypothetical protein
VKTLYTSLASAVLSTSFFIIRTPYFPGARRHTRLCGPTLPRGLAPATIWASWWRDISVCWEGFRGAFDQFVSGCYSRKGLQIASRAGGSDRWIVQARLRANHPDDPRQQSAQNRGPHTRAAVCDGWKNYGLRRAYSPQRRIPIVRAAGCGTERRTSADRRSRHAPRSQRCESG